VSAILNDAFGSVAITWYWMIERPVLVTLVVLGGVLSVCLGGALAWIEQATR